MKNYEIELMKEHNNKMLEYLEKGYILRKGNSSMGYYSFIELFHPECLDKFIRIYVREVYQYENPEGFNVPERNYNLRFFELRVAEMNYSQSFEREDDLIEVIRFYVIRNAFLTKDGEFAYECNKKAEERYLSKFIKSEKTFKPSKRINIKGFKSLKPEDIEIVRSYETLYRRQNSYIIKNLKNEKTYKKNIN